MLLSFFLLLNFILIFFFIIIEVLLLLLLPAPFFFLLLGARRRPVHHPFPRVDICNRKRHCPTTPIATTRIFPIEFYLRYACFV